MTNPATTRWLIRVPMVFLLALGLGCLNYTTGHGIEHHRAMANEHGLPEPSAGIFYVGAGLVAVMAFVLGMSFGRSRPSQR